MQTVSASLQARNAPGPVRNLLIWLATILSIICIGAPLALIFSYAFSKGVGVFSVKSSNPIRCMPSG